MGKNNRRQRQREGGRGRRGSKGTGKKRRGEVKEERKKAEVNNVN